MTWGRTAGAAALALAVAVAGGTAPAGADTIDLTPTYGATLGDAVTGDNFIAGEGWYVDPGADSHEVDVIRERPLSTNTFSSAAGEWVHPGTYYAYLDITGASWGFDGTHLYFRIDLYGIGSRNDPTASWDFESFGSGTYYDILLGQHAAGEANGSMLLRVAGDKDKTWTGSAGDFESEGAEGYLDANGNVGDSGITTTKEEGDDAGDGYEKTIAESDGGLADGGSKPKVLWSRITTGPEDLTAKPYVEIAFDYATYNLWAAANGLLVIDPNLISFLVFEANRGTKADENYLWNDKWTLGQSGSPYMILDENGDPIDQLGNVYELDRLYWSVDPVPEPATSALVALGVAVGYLRHRRRKGRTPA